MPSEHSSFEGSTKPQRSLAAADRQSSEGLNLLDEFQCQSPFPEFDEMMSQDGSLPGQLASNQGKVEEAEMRREH